MQICWMSAASNPVVCWSWERALRAKNGDDLDQPGVFGMDADLQEPDDDDGGDRSGGPPLCDCRYDGGRKLPSKGGNDQQPTGDVNFAHERTGNKSSHQRKWDTLTGKFDDRWRQKYLT